LDDFECDKIGFVDSKIVRFTHFQSLIDEFGIKGKMVSIHATAELTLQAGEVEDELGYEEEKSYQANDGKLLYLVRWSRPEIANSVRELSKFASKPVIGHVSVMNRIMNYCVTKKDIGWILKPFGFGMWIETDNN
jgi:hypothetical protein